MRFLAAGGIRLQTASVALLAILLPVTLSSLAAPHPSDVDSLLSAMTLDEKLVLLHGASDPAGTGGAGYVAGIPRLGIPALRMADGPAGIRSSKPATALPAPVMLGATFDPGLARRFGAVIGREGRALGQDVLLSPMVNIVRVPQSGRNFETFSEDPLLAARLVAAEIVGIEGEGMLASVKHYAANNFEQGRLTVDIAVDDRALREIYLPGFEAAVKAGVGSVMCAYNRVNGVQSCDNPVLLTDILRRDWGFQGWVMTDWFARHSADALENGLDQEMPGLSFGPMQPVLFGDSLKAAVQTGRIPEETVNRAVRRILVQMDRMNLLDDTKQRPKMDRDVGAAVALEVALAGAVLLHNEGRMLPLSPGDLESLVVIGPTAKILLHGGGGSSHVTPLKRDSPLAALQRRTRGDTEVLHVPGIDLDGVLVPNHALSQSADADARGLLRTAQDGSTKVDSVIDYTGPTALPADSRWSWTGMLTAPATGDYELKLQTGPAGGTLSVDGRVLVRTGGFFSDASLIPTADGLLNASVTLALVTGESREIELSAGPSGPRVWPGQRNEPVQIRLAWVTPERRAAFLDDAADAARVASAAVVFAYNEGTEGRDRPSLALARVQDALLSRVTAANSRTAVVLNVGDPVLMPWASQVGAILQMWYPGQEGADATAALLLGEANPGGKLPVTFPRSDEETPVASRPDRYPGVDGRAVFDEGTLVGYRWYDAGGVDPLYSFGHGLSYTTFEYEDLRLASGADGFAATFAITNTGVVTGSDVPQVYLGSPGDPSVPMAPKALVGFERVTLDPGETTEITVQVDRRGLSYWSIEDRDWAVASGRGPVYVGSSSRDIRLQGDVEIRREEN